MLRSERSLPHITTHYSRTNCLSLVTLTTHHTRRMQHPWLHHRKHNHEMPSSVTSSPDVDLTRHVYNTRPARLPLWERLPLRRVFQPKRRAVSNQRSYELFMLPPISCHMDYLVSHSRDVMYKIPLELSYPAKYTILLNEAISTVFKDVTTIFPTNDSIHTVTNSRTSILLIYFTIFTGHSPAFIMMWNVYLVPKSRFYLTQSSGWRRRYCRLRGKQRRVACSTVSRGDGNGKLGIFNT
jgi:hypothetical protein